MERLLPSGHFYETCRQGLSETQTCNWFPGWKI